MITKILLEEFRTVAIQLIELKAREMDLRIEICDNLIGSETIGTHNFSQDGFKIKAVKKVSYSFDEDTLVELIDDDLLSDDEINMIRYKPSLNLKEYKSGIDGVDKLDDAIVVKPATPTLTVEIGE